LSSSQGESPNDTFYREGDVKLIASGDMAVMDHDGNVRVVGRHKDMIIRGGVNISPFAIETILSSRFDLSAEVRGVPDDLLGKFL
jgi:acyl-CoA synthetase (AMP-forming)/AMP-acid ligase II